MSKLRDVKKVYDLTRTIGERDWSEEETRLMESYAPIDIFKILMDEVRLRDTALAKVAIQCCSLMCPAGKGHHPDCPIRTLPEVLDE